MSNQNSDKQVNQGAAIAGAEIKEGSKLAKKAGTKAAKEGTRLFMMLPAEAKLVVIGIVLALAIFGIFVNGLNASSMKRVTRQNAIGISNSSNNPTTKEEKYDAIYNKDIAVEDTINLVKVIHESKKKDYEDINSAVEKAVKRKAKAIGADVDVEASVTKAKFEAADSSGLAYLTGSDLLDAGGLSPGDYVSDSVVIGEALRGESGKRGQKAGDQTGKEVATASYGTGWDYALRAKSDITKLKLAEAMKNACENKYIGYDLDDRGSLYSEANIKDWSIKMVDKYCETAGPDLINVCLMYAGINKRYAPMYTTADNIRKALNETGKFEKKRASESDAMPGDILINKKDGRAAIVISSGNQVELELLLDNGSGAVTGGVSKNRQDVINGACAWAEAIAYDDEWHYGEASWAHHNGCYFCGTQHRAKRNGGGDWEKTYCCNPFVHAAYAHGGGDPAMLKKCQSGVAYGTYYGDGWHTDSNWKKITPKPSKSNLQKGDICLTGSHAMLYIGDGKFAHAGSSDNGVKGSNSWKESIRVDDGVSYNEVIRYFGSGGGQMNVPGGSGISGATGSAFQQSVVKWVRDTVAMKHYRYKTWVGAGGPNAHPSHKCPICHPGTGEGWNCIGFAWASWHHGGGLKSKCNCGVVNDTDGDRLYRLNAADGSKFASEKAGVECTVIKNGGSGIPESMLQAGDIILMYSGATYYHTAIYLGNGEYGESSSALPYVAISKYDRSSQNDTKIAIRYAGSGGGAAAGYTKKDSMTVLQEISSDTGSRDSIGYINGTSANCAQSFAYIDGTYAVAFVTSSNSPSYVQTYDKSGRIQGRVRRDSINHANGACSTPDGKFLVAGAMNPGSGTGHFFNVDSGVSTAGSKSLPSNASAIAYDKETGKYILATSGTIRVYDSSMSNMETSFGRTMHGRYYQDVGAGYGFVFACHTESKGRENSGSNFIDIYNESNGDYCGSYHLDYGELESCDVVDGELVLLVHILGYKNYIQHTGIMVSEQGSSGYNAEMITKLDMDILSAYNASISNTSLWLTERKNIKDVKEDWLDKKGYRDAAGRSISLYWFGKNRGQINYEKDLKKKTDAIFDFTKGSYENTDSKHFFKIVVGDSPESFGDASILPVTIKEAEVEDMMNPMFGLAPKEDYVNSLPEKAAKRKEADKEKKSIKARDYYSTLNLDKGAATNLEAVYSISDMTGKMLFGDLSPVPKGAGYADANQVQGTGSLKLPLPAGSFTVTSHMGYRDDVQGVGSSNHQGIDLAASTGTPIYASLGGEVTLAGWNGGYGKCVIVKSGNIELIYGHMSTIQVSKDDRVSVGQIIGQVGSTGNSTGPHLHFEMHQNGKVIDPEPLLGLR